LRSQAASLAFAVRPTVIAFQFGQVLLAMSGLFAMPLAVALVLADWRMAQGLAAALAICVLGGLALRQLKTVGVIQRNEALVLTALSFLVGSALLAGALWWIGFAADDAAFEAISAITTTGLSTLDSVERWGEAFVFARAWVQWYSGLGIVVLAFAFVLDPATVFRSVPAQDADEEDLAESTRQRARHSLIFYALLTLLTMAALFAVTGGDARGALLHALTAVSTAGFVPNDEGFTAIGGWWVQFVALVGALGGAVAFSLYTRVWRNGPIAILRDETVRLLLLLILLGTGLLILAGWLSQERPLMEVVRTAPLLILSAQTTTGFTPTPIQDLDPASQLVTVVAMWIGGDGGSTAGGVKILRVLLALRLMQVLFLRTSTPPHAVVHARAEGRMIAAETLQTSLAIITLFLAVPLVGWFLFLLAGYPPIESLFEVVSATGTVGLSAGISAPELEAWLKGVLCAAMLLGRLEIVAILVLFYPRTWIGPKPQT
jgi:trk system potassium uptake protein TrkH